MGQLNFVHSPVRKRYLFKQGLDHLKPEENYPGLPKAVTPSTHSPAWPGLGMPAGDVRLVEAERMILPLLRGPVPSPRLAWVSNLHPEWLLWGVNGIDCEDTHLFLVPVPLWIISSAPMTSLGRKFGTALPEHQMSVSLPSQVQSSRWATRLLFWWNCSGSLHHHPSKAGWGAD